MSWIPRAPLKPRADSSTTQAQDTSQLTDEQWRQRLSPDAYEVLRHAATERPFTGAFVDNKDTGMYHCAGCGAPLFSSDTKFDSGCGWPSFYEPVTGENVINRVDKSLGMVRTEVLCKNCGGHLGHVFEDGPEPDRPALLHQLGGAGVRPEQLTRARRLVPSPALAHLPEHNRDHDRDAEHDRGNDPDALEHVRDGVTAVVADEPVGDRPGDAAGRVPGEEGRETASR